jgi:hypothetical protein
MEGRRREVAMTITTASVGSGLKGKVDAQADPQAAMEKVHSLAEAVTRPKSEGEAVARPKSDGVPPTRQGAYKIRLPDSTAQSDKGIGWQEILFEGTNELFPTEMSDCRFPSRPPTRT